MGEPDHVSGSGFLFYYYELADGSVVRLSFMSSRAELIDVFVVDPYGREVPFFEPPD